MASIMKVVGTIDLQSDILGKEAGALVKGIIEEFVHIIKEAIKKEIAQDSKKEEIKK